MKRLLVLFFIILLFATPAGAGSLDTVISNLKGDFQDILTPVATRTRFLLNTVFDYAVANPTSTAAQAQTSVLATYSATYSDNLVSNLSASTVLVAFINRNGVGVNLSAKWISVRDWIVARKDFKPKIVRSFEEGTAPDLATLWYLRINGDRIGDGDYTQASDIIITEILETTPGPTYHFVKEKRWGSVSLGKTVHRFYTNTYDGKSVKVVEGALEVIP